MNKYLLHCPCGVALIRTETDRPPHRCLKHKNTIFEPPTRIIKNGKAHKKVNCGRCKKEMWVISKRFCNSCRNYIHRFGIGERYGLDG